MGLRTTTTVSLVAAVAIALAPGALAAHHPPTAGTADTIRLDLTPRLQWNANDGYCGETSLISAGMHYGQYTSQWTARALASPEVPQTERRSQLLLGVNDIDAAAAMRLSAVAFDNEHQGSTPQFLAWVKTMLLRGDPVIIGVLMKMSASDGTLPGDPEYDHIVPVLGVDSAAQLTLRDRRYRPNDALIFSDNSGGDSSSMYRLTFAALQRSRTAANRADAPRYSLLNHPLNYGIAVTGVMDPEHVTIPVRLTSSEDGEGAQEQDRLPTPPAPIPMEITATVTIPDPSVAYHVYLYDDFAKVPIRAFNATAGSAIESWTIPPGSADTWTTTISVMSDQTRVFRAVPASAA